MDTATAAATAATALTGPPWHGGPPPFAPILGALMFCLLIALALGALMFTVMRRRHGAPPPWARTHGAAPPTSPEDDARRTLADRFAKGDLTVEEFMERASALNWTPGTDDGPRRR